MLSQENYRTIALEKQPNGVLIATLNRPEKLNAVDGWMHRELARLPREADADPEVKVMVITGAGRAFCAGGDFSGTNSGPEPSVPGSQEARQIVDHLLDFEKPVISAVNGYAMGLGSTIALLADIVVAAESAVIADTQCEYGSGRRRRGSGDLAASHGRESRQVLLDDWGARERSRGGAHGPGELRRAGR